MEITDQQDMCCVGVKWTQWYTLIAEFIVIVKPYYPLFGTFFSQLFLVGVFYLVGKKFSIWIKEWWLLHCGWIIKVITKSKIW